MKNSISKDSKKQGEFEEYTELLQDIYASINTHLDGGIIVDSSKDLRRLSVLSAIDTIELFVVHLVRNPRAVAYSWTKKRVKPEFIDLQIYMDQYDPMRIGLRWLYKNAVIGIKKHTYPHYVRIYYDDFVQTPKETIQTILTKLSSSPFTLDFLDGDLLHINKKTHSISGNPVRFESSAIKIEKDDKWRKEMPFIQKAIVSLITWPLELAYFFERKAHSQNSSTYDRGDDRKKEK